MTSRTSSPNDDEVRDGTRGYRKRHRAACTNCRRKKVRCTGERPVCALCDRTSQGSGCRYDATSISDPVLSERAAPNSPQGGDASTEVLVLLREMNQRMLRLENAVANLTRSADSPGTGNSRPRKRRRAESAINTAPSPSPTVSSEQDFDTHPPPPNGCLLADAANVYVQYCHNQPYAIFQDQSLQHVEQMPRYLQYAIVAAAARFSNLSTGDGQFISQGQETVTRYAAAAWRDIKMPWSSHEASVVFPIIQAIHLLSVIDFTAGRCSTAWVKLGMAIRLAYHIRLHVEEEKGADIDLQESLVQHEDRRRVFWSIYLLDRLISCSKERSPAILDDDCKLYLPSSNDNFRAGQVSGTFSSLDSLMQDCTLETTNASTNCFALVILLSAVLGRVSQYVLQEHKFGQQLVPWSADSPHARIDALLLHLEGHAALTGSLFDAIATLTTDGIIDLRVAGHCAFARMLYHLCYCLLYHPFLLRRRLVKVAKTAPPSFVDRLIGVSQIHAAAITEDVTQICVSQVLPVSSFYSYCSTVSGSIHAIGARDDLYEETLTNLSTISQYWQCAGVMREKLERARKASKNLGAFQANVDQDHQNKDDILSLWNAVDYIAMSTPTTATEQTLPLDEFDISDLGNGLDPSLLDFLAQQPDLGIYQWGDTGGGQTSR